MNKTKIEWCDSTWNPVTGCLHGCGYCYARGIAQRFGGHWNESLMRCQGGDGHIHDLSAPMYRHTTGKNRDKPVHNETAPYPFGFEPTFHRYRLGNPARLTKPRTIFVCSMADLFGDWVPDEWIKAVFDACRKAPQHRYLFLTKNPQRYNDLLAKRSLPELENFWYGGTRTGTDSEREHEAAMTANTFLSVEPLLAPMERATLDAIELWGWIILGAETGNRKDKVVPELGWISEIVSNCEQRGVPVFMKDSLVPIVGEENMRREFPWEVTK